MEGAAVSKELMDLAESTEARYELIEKLMDIGEDADGIHLQVQWLGLPDQRDWTWIPLSTLYEDAPELLASFLSTYKRKKSLIAKAQQCILSYQ